MPVKTPSQALASLQWGSRTYVMGILNITPDSFSGDGLAGALQGGELETVLGVARAMLAAGADIIDVGGESTRPGAVPVDEAEELKRVIPVIAALHEAEPDALISVDTYRSAVAEAAIQAGAHILNDVWGLRVDPLLGEVAARHGAPLVLMHNRSRPSDARLENRLGGRYVGVEYDDLIGDVCAELLFSVDLARRCGVRDEQIILDPGIGFGKTVTQNLELLNHLGGIKKLGYPLLIGPSRKSFIGYTLDVPPDQRVEGTAAAVAVGIVRGADVVRVHDVEAMVRVTRMSDAIVRGR